LWQLPGYEAPPSRKSTEGPALLGSLLIHHGGLSLAAVLALLAAPLTAGLEAGPIKIGMYGRAQLGPRRYGHSLGARAERWF
jgi:hypothetical protein